MISEEKMIHIVHLILDGLQKADMVEYPNKDETVRETKRICLGYLSHMSEGTELARRRILSQKSPPPENSPQWETLYRKYYEEELRKKGG